MKPEDRRRLKQHIDMIVNHNAPSVTFCPNCECERETTLYSEVRECTFCREEFEVVGGIKPSNSDVSMTESVLMDIKTCVLNILHEAITGFEPKYRYEVNANQRFIRWGAVERDMIAVFDSYAKPSQSEAEVEKGVENDE